MKKIYEPIGIACYVNIIMCFILTLDGSIRSLMSSKFDFFTAIFSFFVFYIFSTPIVCVLAVISINIMKIFNAFNCWVAILIGSIYGGFLFPKIMSNSNDISLWWMAYGGTTGFLCFFLEVKYQNKLMKFNSKDETSGS